LPQASVAETVTTAPHVFAEDAVKVTVAEQLSEADVAAMAAASASALVG
jgi:hypothetical protein